MLMAQEENAEAGVVKALAQMFDGMRAADSTALAAVFHPEARLMTVDERSGSPEVRSTPIAAFISQIGKAEAGQLDEKLYRTEVRVDGALATAWTEYGFFFQGKFSHCGVNAFQFARNGDGNWQIIQIIDTRQREGCDTEERNDVAAIDLLVDDWHHAAAVADEDAFFGAMTEDAIYIGTDATERWLRDGLREWAKFAFDRESAWAFKASDRMVYFDTDQRTAWWEESLETWMGPCRGSGVAVRAADGQWRIKHYHLSVTIDNDKIEDFIKLTKKE